MDDSATFNEVGFLSHELRNWATDVQQQHSSWFDLIGELNREAMRNLYGSAPRRPDKQQLLASLLLGRTLQSFQGAVLLAARGMCADARTLIRSAAESAIALGGLAHDAAFINDLAADHERHELTMANALLNDLAFVAESAAEDLQRMRAVIEEIKLTYNGKPGGINWEAVAMRVGMKDLYLAVYRDMSGDGAHASVKSLMRHVQADHANEIENLVFEPRADGLPSDLSAVISTLLCALEAFARIYKLENEAVARLALRWRELSGAT